MEISSRSYRLTFTERILGTCPGPELYEKYIVAKAPNPEDEQIREELETVPEEENGGTMVTRFHRDTEGIYLIDYQVKGFLKESANLLKDRLPNAKNSKTPGIKNLRSKLDNYLFVFPRYIWLAEAPDGEFVRPLRAQTAQGPRVALAYSEYVEPGRSIVVRLDLFPGTEIGWEAVEQILDYGRYKGIGQFRNGSYGRFTWEKVA